MIGQLREELDAEIRDENNTVTWLEKHYIGTRRRPPCPVNRCVICGARTWSDTCQGCTRKAASGGGWMGIYG